MSLKPVRISAILFGSICIIATWAHAQGRSTDATTLLAMNSAESPFGEPAEIFTRSEIPQSALASATVRGHWNVAPAAYGHQQPLSRLGIGANLSPLGIGVSATTILTDFFDARLVGNFLSFGVNNLEDGGVRGDANLHLASMSASLDWYPAGGFFRLSPGMLFYNGNHMSAHTTSIASGISMDGQTYYSANASIVPGSTPLQISADLGLHPRPVSFTLTGGFGKFVPRSQRRWSFPSEFGVVFMGTPTVSITPTGWVCLDFSQTQCSNVANTANPVAQQFNTSVQNQLAKWRTQLNRVDVYPIASFGVTYSFSLR
jgi:hypothetical protein